jgi:hypothetical protein
VEGVEDVVVYETLAVDTQRLRARQAARQRSPQADLQAMVDRITGTDGRRSQQEALALSYAA